MRRFWSKPAQSFSWPQLQYGQFKTSGISGGSAPAMPLKSRGGWLGGFALFIREILRRAFLGLLHPETPGVRIDEDVRIARLALCQFLSPLQDAPVGIGVRRQPGMDI